MTSRTPSRINQFWILQKLRFRLFWNGLKLLLSKSLHRFLSIFFCFVLVWGILFALGYVGFKELEENWEFTKLDSQFVTDVVLNLSFVALSVMLIFSTGIILYTSLFNSPESSFLLSSPIQADKIFAYKFQSAIGFSSWAFVLLASPVLVAYGLLFNGGAPWYFYVLLPLYFLGFVLMPGSIGALASMLLVNFFPRHRLHFFLVVGIVLGILLIWWTYTRIIPSAQRLLVSADAFSRFVGEFQVFRSRILPGQWLARGIRATARGTWMDSLYYLSLIWGNGLMIYLVSAWVAKLLYRRGFNLLISLGGRRRRLGRNLLDRSLMLLISFLDPQIRALILKDFRTFRRDPAQWAQILILLGLIVLFFGYIKGLYSQDISRPYRNTVSLLFLAVFSLLICVYTGRFIFPMLSLEGRKFWILGLLPLERRRILMGKFAFSATATVFVGELLSLCSNLVLQMPLQIILVHAVTIGVVALGLSGLSVGMGALTPNFRENDPSKIAVGLGGTLTLIMGLIFLLLALGFIALPWHILYRLRNTIVFDGSTLFWLFVSMGIGMGVGILITVWPLRSGTKALEKMEF